MSKQVLALDIPRNLNNKCLFIPFGAQETIVKNNMWDLVVLRFLFSMKQIVGFSLNTPEAPAPKGQAGDPGTSISDCNGKLGLSLSPTLRTIPPS